VILTDGELAPADFRIETAELLRQAGPWGQAFPEPVFDGEFTVADARTVGENHLKFSVRVDTMRRGVDAIAFNQAEVAGVGAGGRVQMAYRLDINEYAGRRSLQLVVEQVVPA